MTYTGPATPVDPITVKGQRKRNGSFPAPPPTTGGGGGEEQDELDPDGQPSGGSHACDVPETAEDWNADAASAEALRQFEEKAAELGDDGLYQREFFAFLIRDEQGRIVVSEVTFGDRVGTNSSPTVTPDFTGVTPGNVVGEAHNHPGGGVAPSGDDWTGFDAMTSWMSQFGNPGGAGRYRQYIISRDTTDPNSEMAIRVYDQSSARNGDAGPEVNPGGAPCPSLSL